MCSIQNWKVKRAYAGFGCLFGSICTIMGMLASPVTAQKDKFGEIECTNLTVVDGEASTHSWKMGRWGCCLVVLSMGKSLSLTQRETRGCGSVVGPLRNLSPSFKIERWRWHSMEVGWAVLSQ